MTGKPGRPVSVRFSTEELRRVRALAVIYDTTPSAVIREACRFYLSRQAGTPGGPGERAAPGRGSP